MRGITIRFPGVLALDDVDFSLRSGEVHALMGENGAGKSTLIKALTGVYPIDSGAIAVAGRPVVFRTTADAQAAGISTVYQEVNLCPNLSVGENVMLGHEPHRGGGIDWKGVHERGRRAPREPRRRRSTPARCCPATRSPSSSWSRSAGPWCWTSRVLILDEPTSSLDRGEVEQLFAVIRELRAAGVAILFVSHFLEQVYEISDRVTVLRNGQLVGEYLIEDLPRHDLVTKMIGRELDDLEAISEASNSEVDRSGVPVLEATDVGRRGVLEPADLEVFEGEVVGMAGLLGSGRTELARLLYGADRADTGSISINGEPVRIGTPRHAIEQRIVFSSEDRRGEGIVSDLTVAENIVLGIQARRGWRHKIRRAERDAVVAEYMEALDVRPANPDSVVSTLSGGNQQKVLLARWLATAPELLILDEPTRGIDVGAKADIQRKVAELSAAGLSVIFISSELEEVLRLAQRVVVMRDRREIGQLDSNRVGLNDLIEYIANKSDGSAA